MIFRTLLLIIFTINLSSSVIPEYKAKYKFERDDFSITGIRELKKSNNDDFIFKFNANTLLIVSNKNKPKTNRRASRKTQKAEQEQQE